MHLIAVLLPPAQTLTTNEGTVIPDASVVCTVMQPALKQEDLAGGSLGPLAVQNEDIGTIPGCQ